MDIGLQQPEYDDEALQLAEEILAGVEAQDPEPANRAMGLPRAARMCVAEALATVARTQTEQAPLVTRPHFGPGSGNHNGRTTSLGQPSWEECIRGGQDIDEVGNRLNDAMIRVADTEGVPRKTRRRWIAAARGRMLQLIAESPELMDQAHEAALDEDTWRRYEGL